MIEIHNKQARYNYFILEEIEAGIVLTGTEIKAIRKGHAQLKDSYAVIKKEEAFILNMHISEYDNGNIFNHNPNRTRKLLLHKKEILKLSNEIKLNSYTLIPLKIYFKNNKAKVLIGLCKGKKVYDKRETLKKQNAEREIASAIKKNNR